MHISAARWSVLDKESPATIARRTAKAPSSPGQELLCPLRMEIGAIATSHLAGLSSKYAEIR